MNPDYSYLAYCERRVETFTPRLNQNMSIFIGGNEFEFIMPPGIIRSYKEEAVKYLLRAIKVRMDMMKIRHCEI